jgi:pSer/pThr/pTyr-binding forkhead associated (FHA) protein
MILGDQVDLVGVIAWEDREGRRQQATIRADPVWVGRAADCSACIPDLTVSRHHALIRRTKDGFQVEDHSRNGIEINGKIVTQGILRHGDRLQVGRQTLTFSVKDSEVSSVEDQDIVEETIVASAQVLPSQPKLIVVLADGSQEVITLSSERLTIGRDIGNDLVIPDKSVSRRHAEVFSRLGRWRVRNLSHKNPVRVQGKAVSETKLANGDVIHLGEISITFSSQRPEDRPDTPVSAFQRHIILGILVVLVLIGLGAGMYQGLWRPYRTRNLLSEIDLFVETGNCKKAADKLRDLHSDFAGKSDLEVRIGLCLAEQEAQVDLEAAAQRLSGLLAKFPEAALAAGILDGLGELRLLAGEIEESQGSHEMALRQYVLVPEGSSAFVKAQEKISQIWIKRQVEAKQNQNVQELLKRAEMLFKQKYYTLPINNNAFALYKTVLTIASNNPKALQRIEQIKQYYLGRINSALEAEDCKAAADAWRCYSLVEPGNTRLKEQIMECRKHASEKKGAEESKRVRRILQEGGVKDSSWVLKYLFEGDNDSKDSASSPW